MNDIISKLNLYFGQKAPQLPKEWKEILVKIAPYLSIVGVVLMIPGIMALLGARAMFSGFTRYGSYYPAGPSFGDFGIVIVFTIILAILYIMAIPGLFKKSSSGWNMLFYATLVSGLQSLIMMNLGSLVIGLLIGFYILFQIKPYYFGLATISETPASTNPVAPVAPQPPQSPTEQK